MEHKFNYGPTELDIRPCHWEPKATEWPIHFMGKKSELMCVVSKKAKVQNEWPLYRFCGLKSIVAQKK